ncbi:MAG: NAD(P)H-dependent oxidoreductase [Thermodesulfobacteria bacterium]|nr:NAD(P)H-dependent oxidoreductase [Thermodesulfobacteriota bacterium]
MDKEQTKDFILKAFYFRHACKEFDPEKKIPEEDFRFILETARLSPSSFGFEPWYFLVVQAPNLREKLLPYAWGAKRQIPTCSHLLLCLARKSYFMRWDSDYITYMMQEIQKLPPDLQELKRERYRQFQEEDFKLLESERAMFDWACKQTYIAMANMMTAAAMIGIDSCPIEGFHQEKTEKVLAEHFGVDTEKFGLAYMLCFGYRIKEPREKTRQPLEKIVKWFP